MTIHRDLWQNGSFIDRDTPPWPCPWCKQGKLKLQTRGGLTRRELRARRRRTKRRRFFRRIFWRVFPQLKRPFPVSRPIYLFLESIRFQTASVVPGLERGVFTALFECDNPKCWEVVAAAGETWQNMEWIQGEDIYFPRYSPRIFHPPLMIFYFTRR